LSELNRSWESYTLDELRQVQRMRLQGNIWWEIDRKLGRPLGSTAMRTSRLRKRVREQLEMEAKFLEDNRLDPFQVQEEKGLEQFLKSKNLEMFHPEFEEPIIEFIMERFLKYPSSPTLLFGTQTPIAFSGNKVTFLEAGLVHFLKTFSKGLISIVGNSIDKEKAYTKSNLLNQTGICSLPYPVNAETFEQFVMYGSKNFEYFKVVVLRRGEWKDLKEAIERIRKNTNNVILLMMVSCRHDDWLREHGEIIKTDYGKFNLFIMDTRMEKVC